MKTGRTLNQLAEEITRQRDAKRDFIASTDALDLVTSLGNGTKLRVAGVPVTVPEFEINDLAHRQIAEYTKIPNRYYDLMKSNAPDLLAANVNHWLHGRQDEARMLRTIDGKVRAFLSDRYRPLENNDLAESVLPVLLGMDLEIISCEITDLRLYIKAVDKNINKDIPSGRKMGDGSHVFFDTVSPAIIISNSEVGLGALSIETGIWTRACTNLAIAAQRSMRKYHVGAKHELGEQVYALLSDQTRKLSDVALWAQVKDVVKGAFDQAKFDALTNEVAGLAQQKIEGDVVKVVQLAARKFEMNGAEESSVLKHLIEGGDLSRYGLFNAITRTAEDLESYDRSTDFERLGGQVIELPKSEWSELAKAA